MEGMKKKMEYHDSIIIGAGASGMMCGALLGRHGHDVLLLDKNPTVGKKLLATGNGRCNFTNHNMSSSCYYGDQEFIQSVLNQFHDTDAISLFETFGILHRERDGYCYPYSGQASSVVQLITDGCLEAGARIRCETEVSKVVHNQDGQFSITCKDGSKYQCKQLVMSTGGKAYESLGGDGSGYKLCRSLSHQISDILPALTGLKASGSQWKRLAGIRMQGAVSLFSDGSFVKSDEGEIQIVKDGISGIPVFQLCRLAANELKRGKRVCCRIDFFPEWTVEQLENWINCNGLNKLIGLVNAKWVDVLTEGKEMKAKVLANRLKNYEVLIEDTFGLPRAQVTAGGVLTKDINPMSMESRKVNDLYVIGELLDVDGICGGYNLHFAWATAYICSEAIHLRKTTGR